MARELRPPSFVRRIMTVIPPKFPFEDRIDSVIDSAGDHIRNSRPVQKIEAWQDRLPVISEQVMNTPLGRIKLPELSMPRILPDAMDSRRKEALKAALAIDLSSLIGVVPVVGDVASDIIEDTYGANLRSSLTSQEMDLYTKYDKLGPSTFGLLRAFAMTALKTKNG